MSYYIYLISSLPMLHFQTKPPFSFEEFLGICRGKIADDEIEVLSALTIDGNCNYPGRRLEVLESWRRFDTALRNELVRIRAGRTKRDAARYLRQDGYSDPSIARVAANAVRNPSILEAEKALDEERWRQLDEFSLGHYFDLEALALYALKLLILQRWQAVKEADGAAALEEVLTGGKR